MLAINELVTTLGDTSSSNIKRICPTAPSRPITLFGGFPSTTWLDVNELSENAVDDVEAMDAAAAHEASLLSTEPANIKLGVGGFSMGAATSLYSATCFALGKYGNGNPYTTKLNAAVGLSGWLPCAKSVFPSLFSSLVGDIWLLEGSWIPRCNI